MNASKENARKALEALVTLSDHLDEKTRTLRSAQIICIEEFLEAAVRKLPSDASFARAAACRAPVGRFAIQDELSGGYVYRHQDGKDKKRTFAGLGPLEDAALFPTRVDAAAFQGRYCGDIKGRLIVVGPIDTVK